MHPDKKQFIIINLMGSHFRYNYRYPEKYNIFKPGLDGAFDYMVINVKNRDKLVNIYDNSILYEDFVLAEIIKKINLTESVNFLTFLSDHGENLFDNKMNFFGHASENPTKYEILIPCFVWFSSKYVAAYPKKVDFLIQNKNKRLCSTNIFYSLLDAANIRYQNFEETKSFMNQNFIENDVRKVLLPSFKVVVFDKK